MGIFDALDTAVGGMKAQSFALQNISGNIANSQTTAFKRTDTSFEDLIPSGEIPSQQTSGGVIALASATNNVQGSVQASSIGTYMAINGDGYFVVEKPSSFVDGKPVFDGVDTYTRRGDFQPDKSGYLVNGAGYYLMGIPVDSTTGNLSGSVPQLLQFQNGFLPAVATSEIDYQANLASYPLTNAHSTSIPGSELLNPAGFSANPLAGAPSPAKVTGIGATLSPDAKATGIGQVASLTGATTLASLGLTTTDSITVTDGTNTDTFNVAAGSTVQDVINAINSSASPAVTASLDSGGHMVLTSANYLDTITVGGSGASAVGFGPGSDTFSPTNLLSQSAVAQGQTLTVTLPSVGTQTITFGTGAGEVSTLTGPNGLLAKLQALSGVNATVNTANGNITITAANMTDTITVGGTANAKTFGIQNVSGLPSNQTVIANDLTTFLNESVGGGAVTGYDTAGSPVNVQLRWAKTDTSKLGSGHTDTWNMFYQVNSNATGTQVAWQNAGVNFSFAADGTMTPPISTTTLSGVTIDGVSLGNISLVFGSGGITQYADSNGTVQVNQLRQNGFAAGQLQSVAVNANGRIAGAYSNGRNIDLASITLAKFNSPNNLQSIDGGAYQATDASGSVTYGASGTISGSSLEGSNTDIADEFTKLIVTQQAYSANTRVITTSNQMIQDLLSMLR